MQSLDIAFSPCPNDTFIFHAMLEKCVDTRGIIFKPHISDVEELNRKAFRSIHDITKLSVHAWFHLKDRYTLLDVGAALGFGCGPLLVARDEIDIGKRLRIAVPGEYTTATLLLKLWTNNNVDIEPMRFDTIMPKVSSGDFDAGLIIHEGRFVFEQYNLKKIIDLGQWWEDETGHPIPLGCIALRADMAGGQVEEDVNAVLKSSVEYALQNRGASRDFVKRHSQELDDSVIDEHIALYVNDFTIELGSKGRGAINKLEEMALCKKIL